jgi:ribose transport system substrate-binding protein
MQRTSRLGRRAAVLAATLVAALSLTVAACGDDDDGGGGSTSSSSGGGDSYKMTLLAGVKGDEFYITMNCGAQAEAKKPDALLVAPTDSKAMYSPIKAVADAGSKVVLVDTTLEQADFAVSQIASDNEGGGREAAKALADLIGGSGKVFVVNVKPGISTTDLRAKGFEEEAKKLGLEYVGVDYSQDQPDKAAAIVKAQLAKNPDLKGIFATNLFSAEGSASGLREAGKQDTVKIVSFDAGPKQVQDLQDGLLQALVAQKPADIGAQGVQQAVAALKGEPTKPKIATGSVILTKDNFADNEDAVYKSSC